MMNAFIEPFFTIPFLGAGIPVAWVTLFGLTGNLLFTGRVLVQWIASERRGQSVVPVSFWWISLVAAVIFMAYALMRHNARDEYDPDLPMFLGLSVTLLPYIRNLRIHYHPDRPARRGLQILLPAAALIFVALYGVSQNLEHQHKWLFALGLAGNGIYCSRFIVAWVQAEKQRRAVLPLSFWYLSMVGSLLLLSYSLMRADLVFILGFLFNSIPFLRNIVLIRRSRESKGAGAGE
jgi:lipid-A-disaccharide synthase-like uncharacterized protein